MTQIINLQNLRQKSGLLLKAKITEYDEGNDNDSSIKSETKAIKSNLCYYSDVYILVKGDMKITPINAGTNVAFKNCALFTK